MLYSRIKREMAKEAWWKVDSKDDAHKSSKLLNLTVHVNVCTFTHRSILRWNPTFQVAIGAFVSWHWCVILTSPNQDETHWSEARVYWPQREREHVIGTLVKFKPRQEIVQISVAPIPYSLQFCWHLFCVWLTSSKRFRGQACCKWYSVGC